MKKIILFLIIILNFFHGIAQFSYVDAKKVLQLKETKTFVVLHDTNEDFNFNLKKSVEKNWTVTPYEFIHFKDLEKYINNDKNSFLIVSDFTNAENRNGYHFYDNTKSSDGFDLHKMIYGSNVLSLQFGGEKYFRTLNNWYIYAYGGVKHSNLLTSKLFSTVKIINNTTDLFFKGEIKKLKIGGSEAEKLYNPEVSIADKTIIFSEKEISIYSDDESKPILKTDIANNFTGNFEIVDESVYLSKVQSDDNKYLFFGSYVEGTYSIIYLYDVNGKIYFYSGMNRMAFYAPEGKSWFLAALKKIEKKLKK